MVLSNCIHCGAPKVLVVTTTYSSNGELFDGQQLSATFIRHYHHQVGYAESVDDIICSGCGVSFSC